MDFIDEKNDFTVAFRNLVDYCLQTFLKLPFVLRTSYERTHIKGKYLLAFKVLRHVATHNPVGKTFCDGGLACAGFAYEHRIVLRAPGKYL